LSKAFSEEDIEKEIKRYVDTYEKDSSVKSDEFQDFKKGLMPPHFTFYEKACNLSSKIFPVKPDKKKENKILEALETTHINTTPVGVTSFSILFPLVFIIITVFASFIITTFFMGGEGTLFFILFFLLIGVGMIIPLSTLPSVLANNWRMRASNQMVLSIFYIVSYMRHTSNLELAVKFTSDHLAPPLSLDFKKIIWNVETSRYASIKESLDIYLDSWKDYNMEFVESMHLIISSLYETTEKKRLDSLEKSMSLILEATYEKMLHFAQNLKSPITMLHMLGIILPILGLVITPLVVSFMDGVRWFHFASLYNVLLPLLVWYLGKVILSTRPTGYGQADITDINPELKKHMFINIKIANKKTFTINPKWIAFIIIITIVTIGISPLLIRSVTKENYFDVIITNQNNLEQISDVEDLKSAKFAFLGYKLAGGDIVGPYGLGSTLISILVPFGLALGISFYYKAITKKLVRIREKTKELEKEFASALFQLGNRIGDGLPGETAFGKVAEIMDNTVSGKFFDVVSSNIAALGMGIEDAIFDAKYGAINKFPSALIESSMKVFVESAKKGPEIASKSLINISTYIKEMHRVDERLKDLMAEITSSMKSQINFLAPLISGIVIGLTSMIISILNKLSDQISTLSGDSGIGPQSGIIELFGEKAVPTFYMQIVVGIYVIQITYLLTVMLNTIQNGYDPLGEKAMLGKNIFKSGVLYSTVALIVILLFNIIAASVIPQLNVIP